MQQRYYFTTNNIIETLHKYTGVIRHEPWILREASKVLAKKYKTTPWRIFNFVLLNEEIQGLWVKSYGFDTALGREIKNHFADVYHTIKKDY